MRLVMAVDNNWAIGKDNELLIKIEDDLKYFKTLTQNGVVVMGRKTLESLPFGRPLPNRTNIVFSKSMCCDVEKNLYVVKNVSELEAVLRAIDAVDKTWGDKTTVNVIGGAEIVKMLMPVIDTAAITKIESEFEADRFIPNLDALPDWELVEQSEPKFDNEIKYTFCRYKKKADRE